MAFSQPHSGLRRACLLRECRLRGTRVAAQGVLCNVSLEGAYVAIEPVPKPGDAVELSFWLSWRDEPMVLEAVVCWENSNRRAGGLPVGCGLRFLALTSTDRAWIAGAIQAHSPEPRR